MSVGIDRANSPERETEPDEPLDSEKPQLRLVTDPPDQEDSRIEPAVELSIDTLTGYEERVRMALVARYGPELGDELTAEAMAWAWEHQSRLQSMDNPIGYLIRVGQSRSRRLTRWRRERARYPVNSAASGGAVGWSEPGLPKALAGLDEESRTAIVLVHCFQWTYAEVSEQLDVPLHTVRNRIHRGLHQLRNDLGVK